ncbi:30S ribosomal protein S20 [Salinicoccus albus]|uniref:30S ribosomal protein S20 n=1 Tax=Salinicoccus albus TaxID=418756 RepID=UPI000378B9CC|nr:30S ribosomal protein S20 [Salinicoccus albus]
MPNIKQANKRVKTSQAQEHQNIAQKNAMRTAVKRAMTAKKNNSENVETLISGAVKRVDKASKNNLVHSNKAARMKSKLMAK